MRYFYLLLVSLCYAAVAFSCWIPSNLSAEHEQLARYKRVYYVSDKLGCSPSEARRQVESFVGWYKKHPMASGCAQHKWLKELADIKLKSSPGLARILDVGCNKGYFSTTALNYLVAGYEDQLQQFYQLHLTRNVYPRPCGNCMDCKQTLHPAKPTGQRAVDVLCVEPSDVHVASLTAARDAVYGKPTNRTTDPADDAAAALTGGKSRVNWHIVQTAIANYTGTTKFQRGCAGEACNMAMGSLEVPVTTVDALLGGWGWRDGKGEVDLVKIDTEGFDGAVLAGAYYALLAGKIGTLSYEYHHLWNRTGATLHRCVDYLDDLGYACFFDSDRKLYKLSGGCWDARYEVQSWANIACVRRGSPMELVLQAHSFMGYKVEGGHAGGGNATDHRDHRGKGDW